MPTTKIAEMTTAIEYAGHMISGGNPSRYAIIAEEWVDAGFSADSAEKWWGAGCFDADSAADLRDAGLSAESVGQMHDEFGGSASIGYCLANGDITLADVRQLLAEKSDSENQN